MLFTVLPPLALILTGAKVSYMMRDATYLVSFARAVPFFERSERPALLITLDLTKLALNPDTRPSFEYKKR